MHGFNNQCDDIKTTTKYILETRKYQFSSYMYTGIFVWKYYYKCVVLFT